MSDSTFTYDQDEKVLCFHGPLIYEAKILDRTIQHDDPTMKGPLYYVHYKGWNKKWDEWVDDTRILSWNEENLALQQRTEEFYTKKKPTMTKKSTIISDTSRKRSREELEKEKDKMEYINKPEIRLDLPEALKCQLVDDWENITKNQQLVPLPREPTVTQILAQYKQYRMEKKSGKEWNAELMDEVIEGLCMYFNKALGTMLLYQFERQQYSDIRRKNSSKDMADIYGAEHLLRLYVQLPNLIAHTSMDESTVVVLAEYLADILKYIQKMQKQFFVTEYQNASPSYVSLVNGN
ncbi:MRG-domain-containing protein [Halteromyces radiatus]|uniref:MRG-domain-containing protein n=1 Tax=Halteromyces radiatus TaxID=101107 RepID=UPI00221F3C97|nr:MRG-domain-containing protein [Halteromyces radiatus]KAI8097456.1 MRG-domain-containing protein [Halteromyces radiatus]